MRRILQLIVLVLLGIFSPTAFACKILVVFPEHLAVDIPEHYYVVLIRKKQDDGYLGKVTRSFGGHFQSGRKVFVRFKDNEEAHAICPFEPSVGRTYLLHSDSSSEQMEISRYFGMDISSKHPQFHGYVQDLAQGNGR